MPYAVNDDVNIHYEVEGRGPALALMHGFSRDLRSWYEHGYAQELSRDHKLILIDARGHGASDKPHNPEAYEIGLMISDVVAVLDNEGVSKAGYFGYSMGGRIGFRIPQHSPNRFSSLILGGATYPIHGDEDAEDETLTNIYLALEASVKESPDNPMASYLARREKAAGQTLPPASRAVILSNDSYALQAANQAHRREVSPSALEVLPRFNLPCLVFVGEADQRYLVAKECAKRIPDASFVSFSGLDHVQAFQRSDLVLPHVRRFLASYIW
jgi:pimeloyl-ACP methyl ester carboxylesterase